MQAHKCQILHEITKTDQDVRVEVANTTLNAIYDDDGGGGGGGGGGGDDDDDV